MITDSNLSSVQYVSFRHALLCLFLLGTHSFMQPLAGDTTPTIWRCAANGGINALYCLLQIYGVKCDYTDLLNRQSREVGTGPHTAVTLIHLADQMGFPVTAVNSTIGELRHFPMPVIVHVDGETPENGAFLVLVSIDNEKLHYVNGPTATLGEMPAADFRRVWSGLVLCPKHKLHSGIQLTCVGFVIGALLASSYAIFASRSSQKHKHGKWA